MLNKDDWILDDVVFNNVGIDILQRWEYGKGTSLDIAKGKDDGRFLDFQDIYQGECVLKSAFARVDASEENLITAIVLLDSIYHTNLSNPIRYAKNLYRREDFQSIIDIIRGVEKVKDNQAAIVCVRILAELDKNEPRGSYTYSFATKFCNWINCRFPIFDRFVAGAIYNKNENEDSRAHFAKSALGDYAFFVNEYDRIVGEKILTDYSYKEIDICIWTYAKIHKLAWDDDLGIDVEYKSSW